MKKIWIGMILAVSLMLSALYFPNITNISDVCAAEEWSKYVAVFVEAPTETFDKDTVEVSVTIDVPAGGRLDCLRGSLMFDSQVFSYLESDLQESLITFGNLGNAKGKIPFLYNKSEPIPAGNHTLFSVRFSIAQETSEGEYRFDVQVEEAYNTWVEGGTGTEDIAALCTSCDVYVGERFRITPDVITLQEGEREKLSFNKALNGQIINYNEDVISYVPETQEIVAKQLPDGVKRAIGTLSFASGSEIQYVTVTVLKPVPEPELPSVVTSSVYTIQNGFISRIPKETSASVLLQGLNEKEYIRIYQADGRTRVSGNTILGTGYVVKLMNGDMVRQSYTLVVTGDVNGDGKITATDYVNVKFCVLKKQSLSGAYANAGDVNGDGSITATDYVNIKFDVLKRNSIAPR